MRRAAAFLLALALSGLSGCSRALLGNYRNIEELQVIQTLGLDGREGGVFVSFSTGRDASGREVVRMGAEGESISGAMQALQGYSVSGELFFSNTGYILLGEEAARDAGSCLDYIERASEIRLDTPLFVVRGAEAGPLVTAGGGEDGDITEIMSSLERFIERRAAGYLPTCADIARSLARSGAALACAIAPARAPDGDYLTAVSRGYAVLRDGELCGYVEGDAALAAAAFLGGAGEKYVEVDGMTLKLISCGARMEPVWDGGELAGLEMALEVQASVIEARSERDLNDEQERSALEEALAGTAAGWMREVLDVSQGTGADFLGLGAELERRFPARWRDISPQWDELFPGLEIELSAGASVLRSYGFDSPPSRAGEG